MASLFLNEQLPTTSEQAIREFNEKYLALVSAAPPSSWAEMFVQTVSALRTTYPLSALAVKFKETNTVEGTFTGMDAKYFDLTVKEFDSGVEARLLDLFTNTFEYRNWGRGPAELRLAESRMVAQQLVRLIEAGTGTTLGTCPWDGLAFFSASHKSNPFVTLDTTVPGVTNTWSNYNSAGLAPETLANIAAEMTSMRDVRDTNGNKLGVEPDEIWLPTAKFQAVSDKLNQAFLATGESNYMSGKLKPVHVPEFTDVNDWYLVDSKLVARGFDPMIASKFTPPNALSSRTWDENSDFFKKTGKIRQGVHIFYGFAYALPHAVRRIAGA
jgi:phage major head subunit gpT-like protein